MSSKAPSAGTKVTSGQDEGRENPGYIASDSLAAESNREGGGFSGNNTQPDNANAASNSSSFTTARSGGEPQSESGGAAPSYVSAIPDTSGPHGKNLHEGGLGEGSKDGLEKAFAAEPGSQDDPSRAAEQQMLNQTGGGQDAAPKQAWLSNESPYKALNSESSA